MLDLINPPDFSKGHALLMLSYEFMHLFFPELKELNFCRTCNPGMLEEIKKVANLPLDLRPLYSFVDYSNHYHVAVVVESDLLPVVPDHFDLPKLRPVVVRTIKRPDANGYSKVKTQIVSFEYSHFADGKWETKILTLDGKWEEGSIAQLSKMVVEDE